MKDTIAYKAVLGLACSAALLLFAGCMTGRSGGDMRTQPYRPVMADRSPWAWNPKVQEDVLPVVGQTNAVADQAQANVGVAENKTGEPSMRRVLRTGTRVVIYLRDIPPQNEEIKDEIDEKGNVNLPLIGTMHIEGLTTDQAEDIIEKAYIEGQFYRKISVIVVAGEDEYFVRGEVKREGRYPMTSEVTLLQAITTAGGYTDFAKESEIKVIRGEKVLEFNGPNIERRKDKDPLIYPGDIIMVPRSPWGL